VKLIDAGKRLSLQVHPDEEACRKFPGAEPKTEMWYVIAAEPDARIFAGLKSSCTRQQFIQLASTPEVEQCLQSFKAEPGDAYFIRSGTVHAIGAGNLLLEIQQNSDTTYRISDWGRLGPDGKPRELHLEQALECVDFANRNSPRVPAVADKADFNRKFPVVNNCTFFQVDNLLLVDSWRDTTNESVFHLLTPVDADIAVETQDATVEVPRGRTCLVPAACGVYKILLGGKRASVVKTIPS
jgi:mannose-6-phosphate isomerase